MNNLLLSMPYAIYRPLHCLLFNVVLCVFKGPVSSERGKSGKIGHEKSVCLHSEHCVREKEIPFFMG